MPAAKVASQPVLMFLDADVLVHPDTRQRAYQAVTSSDAVGAVFGAYDDAPLVPGLVSQYRNAFHGEQESRHVLGWLRHYPPRSVPSPRRV